MEQTATEQSETTMSGGTTDLRGGDVKGSLDREPTVGMIMDMLVRSLVDRPEEVQLTEIQGTQATVIEVRVAKSDHGKLVGRRGRTADAIRDILVTYGGKRNRRFMLEILE